MKPEINGNKFVKDLHVFVCGTGCFFPTKEIAIKNGTSLEGVGLWIKELTFNGSVWYQAGNTNTWN